MRRFAPLFLLQLGGSDPLELARAAQIGADFGYDEVNLNVGCPSDRVKSGYFGACLMANPQLVADCISAMKNAVEIPVSVKCRLGIDDQDINSALDHFIDIVADAGCKFVIHARKAWLKGLSPKQNRDVPPLEYDRVYLLKQRRNDLVIIINGGIMDFEQIDQHLANVDGVMLGRAAYHDPWLLSEVDRRYYSDGPQELNRADIVAALLPYIEEQLSEGVRLQQITRHMLGLFNGQPGAKTWRRILSEGSVHGAGDASLVRGALERVEEIGARNSCSQEEGERACFAGSV